jgi:ribosome-associated protein
MKKPHARRHAVKPAPEKAPAPADNLRALETARRIATLALDKKASEVVILDVRGMTSYADYFVVCHGDSERQVSATAEHVFEQLKAAGNSPLGFEGFESGHWVLLDYGEVVAHFFHADARAFYDLEGLWSDAPREKVA